MKSNTREIGCIDEVHALLKTYFADEIAKALFYLANASRQDVPSALVRKEAKKLI